MRGEVTPCVTEVGKREETNVTQPLLNREVATDWRWRGTVFG